MWRAVLGCVGFCIRVHQPSNKSNNVDFGGWCTRFDSVITSSGNVVALSKIIMVIKNKKGQALGA